MSTDLKPGDLAIVVHQHCNRCDYVGRIVEVISIPLCENPVLLCKWCFGGFQGGPIAEIVQKGSGLPRSWLRKLPPLAEPAESYETDTATAKVS